MLRLLLPFLAAFSLLSAQATPQTGGPDPIPASGPGSKPLRVFLRSGPKSHGPGDHDHPSFLRDWVPLLNARGAVAKGGDVFPTAAELAETDVVIIHRQVGGNFKPAERALIDAYAQRGGGFVVIHAGAVASQTGKPEVDDPATDYYRDLIGGTWRNKVTKWREGPMQLNFVDKEHPITKGIADFGMKDEIYYDLEMLPGVHALATAPTPKKKGDGFEAQTQLWTYEKPGAQRAFVFIPGHTYMNFARPDVQTLLLRGIAWAGKKPIDTLSAR